MLGDINKLKDIFTNPPIEYRSFPFWAWNGKLEKEELTRQINGMKEQGIGGFFMHSRDGLETIYMGEEWMELIKSSVNTAKSIGMHAWLYDEDRWPSGSAGGSVPAKGDAYRAKGLTLEVLKNQYEPSEDVYLLFKAVVDNMSIVSFERLNINESWTLQNNEEVFLVFRIEVSKPSEWFNNEAPPDNMNPDCVKEFIKSTYDVYKNAVGAEFGRTIPGIFTDEPSVHDRHCKFTPGRGWIPWTYNFSDYFLKKRGYDILASIPFMYFDGEDSISVRHDYWHTLTELFCEAYSKQLGEWCKENKLDFTGHFLWENSLGVATRVSGAIMPHYRYQQVPGVDLLCEQVGETISIKQCTSVANQYDRKFVISETYGCTGWEFTFEGQKWLGDWQFVMGVNRRSQHLALYSLKGCRKRDYPPTFNYNTTWWRYNRVVEDYFARISAIMSQGKVVRELLVLHPASTAWTMMGSNPYGFAKRGEDRDIPKVNANGDRFNDFLRALLGMHYDYDIGDETIMEEHGSISGARLFINQVSYKVVILPRIKTMFKSTRKLLKGFMDGGGRVIAVEPLATMIEGRYEKELQDFYNHRNMVVIKNENDISGVLESILPRKVSIKNKYLLEEPQLLYMLREYGDSKVLFIINNDRNKAHEVTIEIDCIGEVEEWNPLTGDIKELEVKECESKMVIEAIFEPVDSKIYIIKNTKSKSNNETSYKKTTITETAPVSAVLGPKSKFTRTMPNVLVLDKCYYRINHEWSEEVDVWQAQRAIRDTLGMRQIYNNGILQRYKWISEPHPNDGKAVEFRFIFNVKEVPLSEVFLVIESPEDFTIYFNGVNIPNIDEGWYLDKSFRKIRLSRVHKGLNEIVLSCEYKNRMEVEDCYIIGEFGVDFHRDIVAEPKTLNFGDWCFQGYFHYCGSMIYHFNINWNPVKDNRAIMVLGDYSAVTIEIVINGESAGSIPWRAANKLEITNFLQIGINNIDIEVVGSPRNMLGPFHQARGRLLTTSCESFRKEGVEYTPQYIVNPYGLFEQIHIYYV